MRRCQIHFRSHSNLCKILQTRFHVFEIPEEKVGEQQIVTVIKDVTIKTQSKNLNLIQSPKA